MDELKPAIKTQIIPYIFYRDVPAALDWLARAFGFTEVLRHPTPHGMHAEMTLDGQFIMMGQGSTDWRMQSPSETKIATMGIFYTWMGWMRITSVRATLERRSLRRRIWAHLYRARSRWASVVLHRAAWLNSRIH
jgi:hypothetical protein